MYAYIKDKFSSAFSVIGEKITEKTHTQKNNEKKKEKNAMIATKKGQTYSYGSPPKRKI